MGPADFFQHIYVVNLPERADRRRGIAKELDRVGLAIDDGSVNLFPAVRPDDAAGFPSIGARGCFLSHLGVLRTAAEAGAPNVLVMEDDLVISPRLRENADAIVQALESAEWDIAYLGHALKLDEAQGTPFQPYTGEIRLLHFYAVNGPVIARLIDFLETVLERAPGHPDGGPMHVDGAFSTFRAQNPDVKTLVACPNFGWQRSSRSDIEGER